MSAAEDEELTEPAPELFSRNAQLAAAFYAWERRGRGWDTWPHHVALEPPFRPWYLPPFVRSEHDDGRRATFLSTLFDSVFGRTSEQPAPDLYELEEPEPDVASEVEYVELQLSLAPDVKVSPETAENLLVALSGCSAPVSFEIIGTGETILVQLACATEDAPDLRAHLESYFPEMVTGEAANLSQGWKGSRGEAVFVEFGLSEEFMRPLRTFSKFDTDPLIGVVGSMSDLAPGETAVLQVIFQATRAPWSEQILRSVKDWQGKALFVDDPELVSHAEQKVSSHLFAVCLRSAVRTPETERSWQIHRRIGSALKQVASPPQNELIALAADEPVLEDDLLARQTRRSGMLLSAAELVSLVHPPSLAVRASRLSRTHRRTKLAPKSAVGADFVLGENVHGQVAQSVSLTEAQRLRHMHVIGASGTGKSTLLLSLMTQDMQSGKGFAVIDPHGDLVDEVLARVPDDRIKDVVLVDPADSEFPVGFNILSAHSEIEKTLLASDLVAIFRRLSTSWGDQMNSVLANAVLAFLESSRGGTLADLRRFLVEAEFRSVFLPTVQDPEVVYFWQKEFPLLTGRPQASLLTRLDAFLRPRPIRAMMTQQESLDFRAIMDAGKILLVRMAQGAIGEENAALLGSLFVSKIHQLALGRQSVSEQERRPFFVYLDEFASFLTPSMAALLTGARKFGIGLVLAHQELRQLLNQDRDVASAVLANAATRVCFRVGDDDAKKLEDGFASFTARDIQNLGVGQAICRVERSDWDFSLSTQEKPAALSAVADRRAAVRDATRRNAAAAPAELPIAAAVDRWPQPPSGPAEESFRPKQEPNAAIVGPLPRLETVAGEVGRPAGRGGARHRYLQELIRRWGEANGWKVTLEKEIMDGLGRVDVVLERPNVSVACEVAISPSVEHELENIRKCVAAGFTHQVSVVTDQRIGARLRTRVATVGPDDLTTAHVLDVNQFFQFLGALSAPGKMRNEPVVRGYRVRTRTSAGVGPSGGGASLTRTVLASLLRMKK